MKVNEEDELLFISGNVASSKNGRTFNMKLKRSLDSKSTQKYKKVSKDSYRDLQEQFLSMIEGKEKPYKIGFHFVRDSRRKFDFINPVQTVQDLMVRNGWLEDDNMTEMIPFPLELDGKWYSVDKENTGVFIKIE